MLRCLLCLSVTVWFAALAGCGSDRQSVGPSNVTPEEIYRSFMIANLTGDESKIRPLMLDHADAHVLWQGAYPAEVATMLSEQYRSMEISRVPSSVGNNNDRVVLLSSASPMPIAVVKVNGDWKVDATSIIELRKSVEKLKLQ
jgi:hypothetical protein